LGAAVGINLITNNPDKVAGLIIENTFTSIEEMMKLVFPLFSPLSFLVQDKWKNEEKIRDINVPIMFISGSSDSLVPPSMMDRLYKGAIDSPKKQLTKIPNGDHNDTWMQIGYTKAIDEFLSEILQEVEPVR